MGALGAAPLSPAQTIVSGTSAVTQRTTEVFSTTSDPILLLGNGHLKELAWIIPMVIGGIIAMLFIALLCYYGVTALERRMRSCWYSTCGCCWTRNVDESHSLARAISMEDKRGETIYLLRRKALPVWCNDSNHKSVLLKL